MCDGETAGEAVDEAVCAVEVWMHATEVLGRVTPEVWMPTKKAKSPAQISALARAYSDSCLETLAEIETMFGGTVAAIVAD